MNDTLLILLIGGVLFYFLVLQNKEIKTGQNPTASNLGGNQQVAPQSEFDKILGLIRQGVDSVTNIVQQANVTTQRN